jgi:hypothetical protein
MEDLAQSIIWQGLAEKRRSVGTPSIVGWLGFGS